MNNLISMAQIYPEIADWRYLHLELEFYLLNQRQLNSLAAFLAEQTIALLDGAFYTVWRFNGRRTKQNALFAKILSSKKWIDFEFEGAVLGDLVHDANSYKAYERVLNRAIQNCDMFDHETSVDYPSAFYQYFSNISSDKGCKEAVLRLFNEPARKKLARWCNYDITGRVLSCPHKHYNGLYYGTFNFCVVFACLGTYGVLLSEKLTQIAQQAAQNFINVSARVALTPIFPLESCSGHLRYFYSLPQDYLPIRPDFTSVERKRFLYCRGAEWFNILSPLQLSHIPFLAKDAANYPQIAVEELLGGGVAVSLKKPIDQIDVTDLAEVKKLLYNALWPGQRIMEFKHLFDPNVYVYMCKPRPEWELVPVFEDEITIFDDRIVFHHMSCHPQG